MSFIPYQNNTLRLQWATLLLSGFFVLISCSNEEKEEKYIAKVYNYKLYEKDIPQEILEDETTKEIFIKTWVENKILFYQAKLDNRIDQRSIQNQVEKYEEELYYFYLEELLISEKLDTTITENEIVKYYNQNKEEFVLNDFLVKVMYLKVPVDAPDIEKIKRKYLLKNPKDIDEILQYAKIYSSNFYYDEENWIYFDDITKEVPLGDMPKERTITQKKKLYFEDGNHYYFLNILDYKLKDALSPLSFERDNIRKKILNLRIKRLRDSIKEEIIKKEYNKGNVKIP